MACSDLAESPAVPGGGPRGASRVADEAEQTLRRAVRKFGNDQAGCKVALTARSGSDQLELAGGPDCVVPAGDSQLAEDALEMGLDGVDRYVHLGCDLCGP
jgi:hypothetical protein